MTCSGNCEECIYAQRIKNFRCGISRGRNINITCARNCDSCVYGTLKNIQYVCRPELRQDVPGDYFERRRKA